MQTFNVTSGELVISDPCYDSPIWCAGVVKAKNGTWATFCNYNDDARVAEIIAYHMDSAMLDNTIIDRVIAEAPLPFINGVDSGQLGYFDRSHYRNDESAKDLTKHDFGPSFDREPGDSWYRAACEITLGNSNFGVMPFGVVSSSGWGDGSYQTTSIKDDDGNVIALATVFIEDDYSDDDDWDDEEEEIPEEDDSEDEDK